MIVADFADFCLLVYVLIDDLWEALPAWVKPRGAQSECSNSELLTMLVVEECMGGDEETEAISQWQQHRDLFPHLPDRTRLNRRRTCPTIPLRRMAHDDDHFPLPLPFSPCGGAPNITAHLPFLRPSGTVVTVMRLSGLVGFSRFVAEGRGR